MKVFFIVPKPSAPDKLPEADPGRGTYLLLLGALKAFALMNGIDPRAVNSRSLPNIGGKRISKHALHSFLEGTYTRMYGEGEKLFFTYSFPEKVKETMQKNSVYYAIAGIPFEGSSLKLGELANFAKRYCKKFKLETYLSEIIKTDVTVDFPGGDGT